MKPYIIATAAVFAWGAAHASTVTFETVSLPGSGYWNGSGGEGGITLQGATFHNNYDNTYFSWSGFAISNHPDTTTPGWTNQYSAITGGGAGGSANYAVGYQSTYDPVSTSVFYGTLTDLTGKGALITNTTWSALDMLNGGAFGSKKFGGPSGDDPDWFKLTIEGFAGVNSTGTIDFYLADFRAADNAQDFIVTDWQYVNFSALGAVDRLDFRLSSTDNGIYGMNTPAYFAMDDFPTAVPEPSAMLASLAGLSLLLRRKR